MQRMICISSIQYNKMLESYDSAMRELQELKEQLQGIQCDTAEVAPVQQTLDSKDQWLNRVVDILAAADEKTLKELYYLVQGYAGRAL